MSRINKLRSRRPNATIPIEIELRDLDIFLSVVESGSMSLTARRLGLTQSAVSQVISSIEGVLGVKLFDRDIRPLGLTPSGAILRERAVALLRDAREAVLAVRRPERTALPHLHVAMLDTLAATIGPYLVAEMRDMAAQWSLWAGLDHHSALMARKVDVIFTANADAMAGISDFERHEVLREPYMLVVPARYTGQTDDLAMLAETLDFIRFSARSNTGRQIEAHLRRQKIEAPYRMEFDTSDALLAMVANNMGWALATPLCALQGMHHLSEVRCLPTPRPTLFRQLTVVARRGELGDVPARVAAVSASIFKQRFAPHVANFAPEALKQIVYGADKP